MSKHGKIKKALINEMQPAKPFAEFCRENGIVTDAPARKKSGVLGVLLKTVLPAFASVAAVLAIVLPITLSSKVSLPNDSSQGSLMYSHTVTYEEVAADTEVTLLNTEYMFDEYTSFRKMYLDDKATADKHVGYSVSTEVYGATVNGTPYVYGFTMTTAKLNALSGLDKHLYYGYDNSVRYGGVDYSYKIRVGLTVGMSVYYKIGKYEYYLSVEPLGTAAIATNESYMQMFLRLAFDEVSGAQRVNLDAVQGGGKQR